MSRLLFCLSLLFTYSLSVGGGVLTGDVFPADTLSVLTSSDDSSDVRNDVDTDKPTVVSADLSYNHHINNRQTTVYVTESCHLGNHPNIHQIRAPPV